MGNECPTQAELDVAWANSPCRFFFVALCAGVFATAVAEEECSA
jgi:hypothetical protein